MNKIKLLYVENVITRKAKQVQQQLTFFLALENIGYDKQVDIFWAGEDNAWHELTAHYHSMLGNAQEYWSASVII
ncbi:MAG: endonuclease, partial [Methyloprofundus sp.]